MGQPPPLQTPGGSARDFGDENHGAVGVRVLQGRVRTRVLHVCVLQSCTCVRAAGPRVHTCVPRVSARVRGEPAGSPLLSCLVPVPGWLRAWTFMVWLTGATLAAPAHSTRPHAARIGAPRPRHGTLPPATAAAATPHGAFFSPKLKLRVPGVGQAPAGHRGHAWHRLSRTVPVGPRLRGTGPGTPGSSLSLPTNLGPGQGASTGPWAPYNHRLARGHPAIP